MGEGPTQARQTVKPLLSPPPSITSTSATSFPKGLDCPSCIAALRRVDRSPLLPWLIRLATVIIVLSAFTLAVAAAEGVLPVGKDGKPLNLDFEDGTLKDWTASDPAFDKQPIKGDTVAGRRSDMHSQHQGNYWIGSYEIA